MKITMYRGVDGSVPLLEWLATRVASRDRRALAKIRARIGMLEADGRDLRRPIADYLRDGIYELRARYGRVNYRLLYFFLNETVVVISHGITKQDRVPPGEIDLAIRRKALVESDPERYTYDEAEQPED